MLLVGERGRLVPPAWFDQGIDLLVVDDPIEVPFRLLQDQVDVVASASPLPAQIGPIAVPVLWLQSMPQDPRLARALLARLASRSARDRLPLGRLAPGLRDLRWELGQLARGAVAATAAPTAPPAATYAPESALLGMAAAPAPLMLPGVAAGHAVTVLVEPVLHWPEIEDLVDALEVLPMLHIRFRMFRDGVYRVDGMCLSSTAELADELGRLSGVSRVEADMSRLTLHLEAGG